ncbi:IOD2 deiodinase, partial [Polypterus senegalus]
MGMLSVDLLVTLQILPGFFSNCLFLAIYDSVVLVKRIVTLLSCADGSGAPGEWQRMLTSAGLRSIWNSFLLDANKQLPAFRQLVEEFSDVADFLLVYIDEAHPIDGWAVPEVECNAFKIRKHRNLEERCLAAQQLLERFALPPQCHLVADCMDNNANVSYGVAFERVCIVQEKKIAYLGGKGPFFYNVKEVRYWLEKSYGKR